MHSVYMRVQGASLKGTGFKSYQSKILINYNTPQFIVIPEERYLRGRTRSKPIQSRPCSEMAGWEFALSVMASFDLDICRCSIWNNEYLSCEGGLSIIETFFNDELLLQLDLEALIPSGGGWRGMTEGEKHLRRMETKERVKKYVARL